DRGAPRSLSSCDRGQPPPQVGSRGSACQRRPPRAPPGTSSGAASHSSRGHLHHEVIKTEQRSGRSTSQTVSPLVIGSVGCGRAWSSWPPTRTRQSTYSPRKTSSSTVPWYVFGPSGLLVSTRTF